jgi:hypothetical protein
LRAQLACPVLRTWEPLGAAASQTAAWADCCCRCPTAAEAVVQSLTQEGTTNKAYAISSTEGDGPGQDAGKWQRLFASAPAGGSS